MLFNLYDVDGDGFITPADMKEVLYVALSGGHEWLKKKKKAAETEKAKRNHDSSALNSFMLYLRVHKLGCAADSAAGGAEHSSERA